MKSAMGDALKSLKGGGSMKGPAADVNMMDEGPEAGFATGGEGLDLSKIDPALIQAIIKELTKSGMVETVTSPDKAASGASVVSGPTLQEEKEDGSEAAPSREAISAIADGGAGHEQGSLRARAASKAKGHLAQMKGKKGF